MGYTVRAKVEGLAPLLRRIDHLKRSARTRVVRAAVAAGARVVRKRAKPAAPKETGLLRRSLAVKVKTYKTGAAAAVIGPRSGMRQEVVRSRGKLAPSRVVANPVKYAHLIELGTAHAAARPFLRPAVGPEVQAAMARAAEAAVSRALEKGK